jgi:hypothetical protein
MKSIFLIRKRINLKKKMLKLFSILVIQISLFNFKQTNNECPVKQDTNNNYTILNDFDNFKQLDFSECETYFNTFLLDIKPNEKIILDSTLNLNYLKISPNNGLFVILLNNLKGIDYKFKSFDEITFALDYLPYIFYVFTTSNIDFYINNKLISKEICSFEYFYENDTFFNFFNGKSIQSLTLHSSNEYSRKTCPLIFYNTIITTLNIERIASSFLSRNVLSFIRVKENNTNYLYAKIFHLIIKLYHLDLTTNLLNEMVFEQIEALDIDGQINFIQDDLFKSFRKLQLIRFRTQNAKGLLTHKNKWFNSLNLETKQALILSIFQTFSNVTFYDYPDHDFCYLKDFPHQRLVLPRLKPNYKSSCSCTQLFLIQYSIDSIQFIEYYSEKTLKDYYMLNQYYYNDINEATYSKCINSSIEEFIRKCDFEKKLNLCNIIEKTTKKNDYNYDDEIIWYVLDWRETSKYLDLYFSVFLNPILSFISILINILMIKILENIKKNIKNNYAYLKIHMVSNIIFIIIINFDLFTKCLRDQLFCSSISNTIYVQYINVYFIKWFKGSLITFSNITYTSFILTRYIQVTDSKNKSLLRFKKINLKLYLIITIPISVLINIYTIFEYSSNTVASYSKLDSFILFNPLDKFFINLSSNQYIIFNVFQYAKIIFSDLLFYILIIFIDLFLIFFIKKSITLAILVVANPMTNQNIIMKKNSKSKLKSMIILNGINLFIFRFPLVLIDVYGLFYSLNVENKNAINYKPNLHSYIVCRSFSFCESLKSIFYFLYLFSFLIQFFLFLKLDSNVRQSYDKIKPKFLK